MMIRIVCCAVLAVVMATPAVAGFMGDPVADGWTYRGNSYQTGFYVRDNNQAVNYNFDVYRSDYTLAAAQGSFLSGDKVVGLGGVCNGAIVGTTVDNCAINALVKFGSPTATFAAASAYDAEDGHGADIYGGPGYILTRIQLGGATAAVNRWNGSSFNAITNFSGFLQFAAVTEAGSYINYANVTLPTTRIRSWQMLLDIDAMGRLGYADVPTHTSISEVVMQGEHPGGFHFVKALAPTTVSPIPEPATWALLIGGLAMVGAVVGWRRAVTA